MEIIHESVVPNEAFLAVGPGLWVSRRLVIPLFNVFVDSDLSNWMSLPIKQGFVFHWSHVQYIRMSIA